MPSLRPSETSPPASPPDRSDRRPWGLALLVLLLVAGVVLERIGVLDWRAGLAVAQGYSDRWWLAPALALATASLFAASLPGSLMVWIVGILLPPELAAPVFVAGATAGALGARSLALVAGGDRVPEDDRLLRLLARRSDFATLLAVRIAPGFPHSAINLAAGILRVPLARFLVSSALGFAIKGTLYVTAIHQATLVASPDGAISWRTVTPLVAISLLLLLGPALLRRLRPAAEPAPAPVEPV